jgi:hypothetical protein
MLTLQKDGEFYSLPVNTTVGELLRELLEGGVDAYVMRLAH